MMDNWQGSITIFLVCAYTDELIVTSNGGHLLYIVGQAPLTKPGDGQKTDLEWRTDPDSHIQWL